MDGIKVLESQQLDFVQRLKFGYEHLLQSQIRGQNSELVVISSDRLKQLVDFCWKMADKYKQKSFVRDVFSRNLKGKLGEEAISYQLGDLLTEVDYEKRIIGDGKVDFTLRSDKSIGIQVKTRYGDINKIEWIFSRDEINKNSILVCIASLEDFDERKNNYKMIMAGFIPTHKILNHESIVKFKIWDLLYIGGLNGYLRSLSISKNNQYLPVEDQTNKLLVLETQILQIYLNFPEYRGYIFNYLDNNSGFCISTCRFLWSYIYQFEKDIGQEESVIENVKFLDSLVRFIRQYTGKSNHLYPVQVLLDNLINSDKIIIDRPLYVLKNAMIEHHIIFEGKVFDDWINKLKSSDIIANTEFGYGCCSKLFEVQTRIQTLKKELENLD